MGQVLYRKYRSKSLDEIVGQEHITTTLKNALKAGAISHAYLFTGPKGVGKTSIARILAHELNELPYTGEDMHLDIIEIDAASNRGIDEIRDLRDKVNVAPAEGKYKVYIIDEVHMLTTPAFNALLKTLEEPPAHVVFILATTESHKLPDTIVSRTQRYTFRPVEQAKVVEHLKHIAKQEKLAVDDAALELIAAHGEGSFRDSISLLNQATGHGAPITAEVIREMLGLPPQEATGQLFGALETGDKHAVATRLNDLHSQGYQAGMIAKQLAFVARRAIMGDRESSLDESILLQLLTDLIAVPTSPAPDRLLEIVLFKAMPTTRHTQATKPPVSQDTTIATPEPALQPKPKVMSQKAVVAASTEKKLPTTPKLPALQIDSELAKLWPELLKTIKVKHNTVYGILRMAAPELTDSLMTLTFRYAFHQKRMNEAKHRKIISDAVESLTGQHVTIECLYDKDAVVDKLAIPEPVDEIATPLVAAQANSPISTISNIFGGGELLES